MPNGVPQTRPNPPGIEEKVDYIVSQLIDPCDAPLTVWIEKLWPALGRLILAWYVVDLKNIFTAYLRPGAWLLESRSSRHMGGKKGKRGGGAWTVIGKVIAFDPSEFLGRHLAGADELRARPLPPGASWLWILEGVIERFLFYCMVVDLATDFAYEWISGVMETRYCQARDDAVFLGECGPYDLLGIFGWDVQGMYHPQKMRNILFFNGFGVMGGKGPGSAGATAIVKRHASQPTGGWVKCRVRFLLGPSAGRVIERSFDDIGPDGVEANIGCAIQGGDLMIFEIAVDGHWVMEKSHMFYQQSFRVYE